MSIEIAARNSLLSVSVFDRVCQGNRSLFPQRDIVKNNDIIVSFKNSGYQLSCIDHPVAILSPNHQR